LEFARACKENLINYSIEPAIAAGDFADPLCLTPPNDTESESQVIVDFTVTSVLAKSGNSEDEATKKKNTRYKNKDLIVAQIDTTGGMSNALCSLIRHIAKFSDDENYAHCLRVRAAKTVQQMNGLILRRASLKTFFGANVGKTTPVSAEAVAAELRC
jgi:hypothetical protein